MLRNSPFGYWAKNMCVGEVKMEAERPERGLSSGTSELRFRVIYVAKVHWTW